MKKKGLISLTIVCAFCFFFSVNAQGSREPSAHAKQVYLEVFGPAAMYVSANYDTRFKPQADGFGFRVGAGIAPEKGNTKFSIPVQINYLRGKKHQFEGGLGATYYYSKFSDSYWDIDSNAGGTVFASLLVGYRYQPLKKGITARAGASLLYGSFLPIVAPHLGLGFRF